MALVAGILLLSVVAIVLGYWAQRRIRRKGTRGTGIARLAIALGFAELAVTVVFWAVYFVALAPLVTLPR